MDVFEKEIREYERKRETERLEFLKKGADKIRDDDNLLYRLMALHLSQRFKLGLNLNGEPHDVVYPILNHYIDNIDEPWEEWLNLYVGFDGIVKEGIIDDEKVVIIR